MNIFQDRIKNIMKNPQSPSEELIAKIVEIVERKDEPIWLEDIIEVALPKEINLLVEIYHKDDIDPDKGLRKTEGRTACFLEILKESVKLPPVVKVQYVMKTFRHRPAIGEQSHSVVHWDNGIEFTKQDGSLLIADTVLIFNRSGRVAIVRSKLLPAGLDTAWGKACVETLIKVLRDHGVEGNAESCTAFAEKIGITPRYMLDVMHGLNPFVSADVYKLISEEIGVDVLQLRGVTKDDICNVDIVGAIPKNIEE